MATGLRFEPTMARPERVVQRPRLTQRFAERFDHRVTTVVGAAGFGKSTALALAVIENRLQPVGRDAWLSAVPDDDDPHHLLVGLAQALDADPQGTTEDVVAQIIDTVWAEAPNDVALIIDDAHHLASEAARSLLTRLIDELPANGHLVLSSRVPPALRLARLRALGQVMHIGENDLNLDDEELAALRDRRLPDSHPASAPHQRALKQSGDLPRHAATADLQLAAGSSASIEFLWEEILGSLDEDRLTNLKRCAVPDALDDELVADLTDGTFDVVTLVDGLPLVDERGDGVVRLHALLRDALTSRMSGAELMKAQMLAGDAERIRERHDVAIRHYAAAGDESSVAAQAREFVLLPILKQPKEAVLSVHHTMQAIAPDSAVTAALNASGFYVHREIDGTAGFELCAELARQRGDRDLEAWALHRLLQIRFMWLDDEPPGLLERLRELGTGGTFAPAALAHAESAIAQKRGDVETALATLDGYRHLDPSTEIVMRAERLCDLGRPELVGAGLSPDDLADLPPGAEIYISFAMWLRGEAPPELAEAIVGDMIPSVTRRGYNQATLSILAVGTSIALAAGQHDVARRRAEHATEMTEYDYGALIALMARVAAASVAACTESDEAAARLLAVDQGGVEIAAWPARPHLLALPLVYLVRPDARPALDRCDMGPALTVAVRAGQALAALREATTSDDEAAARALAARLPWNNEAVLRVHVLPHHLAELACAAAVEGSAAALDLLRRIPLTRQCLQRVVGHRDAAVAGLAAQELGAFPDIPSFRLDTNVLGNTTLLRDGEVVDDADWNRRARVRELWALLLERRRLPRVEVLETIWPDHPDESKAAANLRSTLSTLQRILEPDRDNATPPYFIDADRDHLVVADSATSSADVFDQLIADAQADERSGLPSRALDTYRRAVELYDGDYLDDIDAAWPVLTRIRLRSLAVSAACRVAELVAAKGEPEQAATYARRAQHIDPLSERAGRALAAAFDATGDRSAARDAIVHLGATLAANEIDPSPATRRLADRLGASLP